MSNLLAYPCRLGSNWFQWSLFSHCLLNSCIEWACHNKKPDSPVHKVPWVEFSTRSYLFGIGTLFYCVLNDNINKRMHAIDIWVVHVRSLHAKSKKQGSGFPRGRVSPTISKRKPSNTKQRIMLWIMFYVKPMIRSTFFQPIKIIEANDICLE